ncbi:MAG: mate efflux family protein, partial [Clostridia bacterium]|nr:mate efflux family protein [Clostridia bacterium]
ADAELFALTYRGFTIFSLCFLFCGIAIYGSGFFTALNNGLVSAIISFLRTLLFQVAAILLLPLWLGVDGVWWSIVAADLMAATVTACFLLANRKKYGY